jgi:hypothetical protein
MPLHAIHNKLMHPPAISAPPSVPSRLSPNGVFTEAFDIVKQHHEVTARVGTPMTGFGADRNSKREGRRNFVQNDVFTDEDGIKHTR